MDGRVTEWHDFFLASAGAAAALAGLLFVAMSINVREIVATEGLPARAGATIVDAIGPLIVSLAVLMPGQSVRVVGAEVLAVGLIAWTVTVALQVVVWRTTRDQPRDQRVFGLVLSQLAAAGALVGGVMLLTDSADGLYAVAVGIALSFVVAVVNGWVLLIEILR